MDRSLEELLAGFHEYQTNQASKEAALDASAAQAIRKITSGVASSAKKHLALLDAIYQQIIYLPQFTPDLTPWLDRSLKRKISAEMVSRIDTMLATIDLSPYRDQMIVSLIGEMITCEKYQWMSYLERFLPTAALREHAISPIKLQQSDTEYHEILSEWTVSSETEMIFVQPDPDQYPPKYVPMVVSKIPPMAPNHPGTIASRWVCINDIYFGGVSAFGHASYELIGLAREDPNMLCWQFGSGKAIKPDPRSELYTIRYGPNCALTGQIYLPAAIRAAMA
jgi:hypothetical protein